MRVLVLALLIPLLMACQFALPGAGNQGVTGANPITGDEITVQSLDDPVAAPVAAEPDPAAAEQPEQPEADPEAAAEPAAVALPKPPEQIACERRGGVWSSPGASPGRTCITRTKDAGKQCRRETDCEGYCLARSATCAPAVPLFGCHAILQADGREVTLCLD